MAELIGLLGVKPDPDLHGHLRRVLAARWLGLDASAGRLLRHPHPGPLSVLGYKRDQPVISAWNLLAR
jgi:Histidine phosphatase superfamily (branch 1)